MSRSVPLIPLFTNLLHNFRLLWLVATTILWVTIRRIIKGNKLPSWPILFEALIEILQPQDEDLKLTNLQQVERLRRKTDHIVENHPESTFLEDVNTNGIKAKWICVQESKSSHRVIFYLHGGAYMMSSVRHYITLICKISKMCEARVFAPSYRLAPENKFPAALEDAVAAYKWLISADGGCVDPMDIIFAGDSAGGGLCIATMFKLRDLNLPLPKAAALISPWVDLLKSKKSWETNAKYDYLKKSEFIPRLYVNNEDELKHPLVSPLYGDFTGLPPIFIQVGGVECLLDENVDMAEKAKKHGVEVELEIWPEMTHVFQSWGNLIDSANKALNSFGSFVIKKTPPCVPFHNNNK